MDVLGSPKSLSSVQAPLACGWGAGPDSLQSKGRGGWGKVPPKAVILQISSAEQRTGRQFGRAGAEGGERGAAEMGGTIKKVQKKEHFNHNYF